MSNELRFPIATGQTLDAYVFRARDGKVWYPSSEAFETWGSGSRTAAEYGPRLGGRLRRQRLQRVSQRLTHCQYGRDQLQPHPGSGYGLCMADRPELSRRRSDDWKYVVVCDRRGPRGARGARGPRGTHRLAERTPMAQGTTSLAEARNRP